MALSENDAAPHNKRGQSLATYAESGHLRNAQGNPFGSRGYGISSRYSTAHESNGYGSAAYAGPGRQGNVQGNAEESGVGSDEDNFDFLDARASVRAQKSSHGRNSVRAPKAPRHNDDLIAMYALIFSLIEAKIPEEIAIDQIKNRFQADQEKQQKTITLYNDFKLEEDKKLDPKRAGSKFTPFEYALSGALLQGFDNEKNGKGKSPHDRAMFVLTQKFSQERAEAILNAFINNDVPNSDDNE